MAALNFPTSPSLNEVYIANGKSWVWDGTAWKSNNSYGTVGIGTQFQVAYYATSGQTVTGTNNLQVTGSGVSILFGANSTSTTTGALSIIGGVGIGQSVSVGGNLQIFNGANYSAFKYTGTANTIYSLPASSPATGTSVLQSTSAGVMSWVPMTATGGGGAGTVDQGTINSVAYYPSAGTLVTGLSSYTFTGSGMSNSFGTNSTSTTSGALVILGGVGITGNAFIGGTFTLTNTTNSTSSTTGSLVVSGGAGVAGTINIGQRLTVGSTLNSTSTTTGALVNSGGLGMAGNAFIGGTITISDTTNSTSSSTGSLVLSGGAGFGKSINVGGNVSARSGFGLRAFNSSDTNFSGFVYTGASNLSYTLPTAYPSTSGQVLASDTSGVMSWSSTAGFGTVNQKSISIYSPATSDEITLMHTFEPITIVQFETVSRGSGAALTYFVNFNTDRSSSIGTTVVLGGTAHTAGLAGTTTGQALTTFTNSSVGSNNFIWLRIGTVSGTMTEFHFTMHYKKT